MSIVEEQNNSTIVENTMHEKISNPHSSRWILIIGIIASIFAIAIIGIYTLYKILGIGDIGPLRLSNIEPLYQTPTQTQEVNETANWKTYVNTPVGYSIKYPQKMRIVNETHQQVGLELDYTPLGEHQTAYNDSLLLNISLSPLPKEKIIDQYSKNPRVSNLKLEHVIIGSLDATVTTANFGGEGIAHELNAYLQQSDNQVIILTFSWTEKNSTIYEKIANQILSTFKFLDKDNNIQTACINSGGEWLSEYNECESTESNKGLDQKSCVQLGGSYNECASACRHNPEAEVCTTVCVKVCKFK